MSELNKFCKNLKFNDLPIIPYLLWIKSLQLVAVLDYIDVVSISNGFPFLHVQRYSVDDYSSTEPSLEKKILPRYVGH